ncbi:MAG: HisA/HisF-related TIM barrel protein, partial [Clostridia bacterium]|nr:HisA/HisF-related TIM barrel protein [Clostridia bacterium]
MLIYPAIDIFEGKAVRLYKGSYEQMTVYGDPARVAADFSAFGAERIHMVDLEGARSGKPLNFGAISRIKRQTGLFCQAGGGIRDLDTVSRYMDAGIDRVILGTAAVRDGGFVERALARYGERIAVGADIRGGYAAISGWTESS